MQQYGRSGGSGRSRSGHSRFTPKIGKPSMSIVSGNRKTEICRNWQQGRCIFGASNCAFAHGEHDLRHQTLHEMEHTGRIPNASKFRCYPCLTWVTTGSCPYFTRCVFIHDPRIRGPKDAYIYRSSSSSSGGGGGGGSVGSPMGRDIFYWPDMPRTDSDGNTPPEISVNYEIDPAMLDSDDATKRAVYRLWYSLVGSIVDIAGEPTDEAGESAAITPSPDPRDSFLAAPSAGLKRGQRGRKDAAGATRATPSRPVADPPRPWRTKDPARRLPLFKLMSGGGPVSPSYVPMPTITGPRETWQATCLDCGLEDQVDGTLTSAPRPLRSRSRSIQQSSFPLAEIGTDSPASVNARSPSKLMSRKERAWRLGTMVGEENKRPSQQTRSKHAEAQAIPSAPRRSTAPPALGREDRTARREELHAARGLCREFRTRSPTTAAGFRSSPKEPYRRGSISSTDTVKSTGTSWEQVVRSALFDDEPCMAKVQAPSPSILPPMALTTPRPLSPSPWSSTPPLHTGTTPSSSSTSLSFATTPREELLPSFSPSFSEDGRGSVFLSPPADANPPAAGRDVLGSGSTGETWSTSSASSSPYVPPGAGARTASRLHACQGGSRTTGSERKSNSTYPFGLFAEGM